jgi:hypothetical protein
MERTLQVPRLGETFMTWKERGVFMNGTNLLRRTGMMALLLGVSVQAQNLQTLHLGALVGVASAQENKTPDRPADATKDEPVVMKVTSATVRDAQGLIFGRLEEIVVDPSSGKIDFALVANAVNTNVIAKITPIPWRLLSSRGERRGPFGSPGLNQIFQVNMEREKLMKAPAFDHRKWPDMSKKDWAHAYLTYYGLEAGPEARKESQTPTEADQTGKK